MQHHILAIESKLQQKGRVEEEICQERARHCLAYGAAPLMPVQPQLTFL